MWIEVFKSGEHKDSSGKLRKFTDDMLDKIASLYNGKVKVSSSFEAPLVKGHPKTDDPAYGWIEKLKRKGSLLLAKLKDVSSEMVDEVKKGLFKKISIALYPDLMLKHVGLLGASAPAVKGLKNVEFDDGEQSFTNYELQITNDEGRTEGQNDGKTERLEDSSFDELRMTEEESTTDRVAELEDENKSLKIRNEDLERGIRINQYREFVNSLIEFEDGSIITPAQGEELIDILISVDRYDMEFNERPNDKKTEEPNDIIVERIKSLFNSLKPRVSNALFSEYSQSRIDNCKDFTEKNNINPTRLELHRKAQELQLNDNNLTYEQAVTRVMSRK